MDGKAAEKEKKSTSQTNKVSQFILQHHIMNNLQKPLSSPLVTKALPRVVLLRLKNKRKCCHKLCGKAFHTCIFLFVFLYIDTSSKHYIAMNKD